jgi:5-formyltetrahydrofolate cyclo-ligase
MNFNNRPSVPSKNLLQLRKNIRIEMRQKRRALNVIEKKCNAEQLCRHLKRHFLFKRQQFVAIYLANDGEIDPFPYIQALWKYNKRVYLPVLHPTKKNQLWFYRYQSTTALRTNRFGISEPKHRNAERIPPWALTLILLPLVAFDSEGGRLGMGGGFYDRTFAFINNKQNKRKDTLLRPWMPLLCGLAHDFQHVDRLPTVDWDVPLKNIATDKKVYHF